MKNTELYNNVKKLRRIQEAAIIAGVHRNTVYNVMVRGMQSAKEVEIIQACNHCIVLEKIQQVKRMEDNKEAILKEIQAIAL